MGILFVGHGALLAQGSDAYHPEMGAAAVPPQMMYDNSYENWATDFDAPMGGYQVECPLLEATRK